MEEKQREIMQHALGLNCFVTRPGSVDYPYCEALVAEGLMTKRTGSVLSGGDYIYNVTNAGRAALWLANPQ